MNICVTLCDYPLSLSLSLHILLHTLHTQTRTHTHTHLQDIVNTIQESWDVDAEARLTAHCIYERLAMFKNKFESSKDSGFFPSEVDAAEVSSRCLAESDANVLIQNSVYLKERRDLLIIE